MLELRERGSQTGGSELSGLHRLARCSGIGRGDQVERTLPGVTGRCVGVGEGDLDLLGCLSLPSLKAGREARAIDARDCRTTLDVAADTHCRRRDYILLAGTVLPWAHYGATVFFEIIQAGFAACFG